MIAHKVDQLEVQVNVNRSELGRAAAADVAEKILQLQQGDKLLNVIFAAAPSQNEFLAALIENKAINWNNIRAFHMDEYVGLPASAPQRFGNFLHRHIFSKVSFREVHYIDGSAERMEEACRAYAELLDQYPPDIVCMGIGENCHIAFNDPPEADFEDPKRVKIVSLDAACRRQQVNDGCFERLDQVPLRAITLTIPTLMGAAHIFCMVPGATKASAVKNTLSERVSTEFPSTILRTHRSARLYLDKESAEYCLANKMGV
ncbi:glucosamine-6-phosphate deaminase [Olivibacter sp. SDN3]|uniref:glucosamine-6-phosphate deaminase n=1 Tax=Olivibacter sp. SDN3 TaxID=2764720 RepID=UPI0016511370|nr:glucosamine-6-phosphate deaminase [Olivibacter sp. SDN3]QNL49292.1 glucosamine-6-phosphate deaminase [Olivibacter sp. SDN3]